MAAREVELKMTMIRALDGDASAYNALLRTLAPLLRAFFRRSLGSDDVAEDLVQETLIAVHTRRATFDRARPFSAWLYAIARYKLADHFRRSRRFADFAEVESELPSVEFESATSASMDIERLLGLLPDKQSNVIRATKIEGHSLAEAATTAGISPSDAKMSVYRGLKRLSARVEGKVR
jgi:RNA polymerase sigma-70 factor (ECF subfamily)